MSDEQVRADTWSQEIDIFFNYLFRQTLKCNVVVTVQLQRTIKDQLTVKIVFFPLLSLIHQFSAACLDSAPQGSG